MATWFLITIVLIIAAQRLLELRLAARNRAWALAQGGQEFGGQHYLLFVLLHVGWFMGWVMEALLRGAELSPLWWLWLLLLAKAQGIRYWAIRSLGRQWNTRILIIPGTKRIRQGPYRFLPHPNYLAVALELLSVPLIFGAWITALAASILNAALLLGIRIPAEERALKQLE